MTRATFTSPIGEVVFIGTRSGRAITTWTQGPTNVVAVSFGTIDKSRIVSTRTLDKREVSAAARRQRKQAEVSP